MQLIRTTNGGLINTAHIEAFTRLERDPDLWRVRLHGDPDHELHVDDIALELLGKQPADRLLPHTNHQLALLRVWRDDDTGECVAVEQPIIGWRLPVFDPEGDIEPVPIGMDGGFFRPQLDGVLARGANRVYCFDGGWQERGAFIERASALLAARAAHKEEPTND